MAAARAGHHAGPRWRSWVGWCCGWLLTIVAGRAFTVVPPNFENLVSGATQILRIEVTGTNSRWDEAQGRKVIHTYVEAKVVRVLKGQSGPTVTLRFFGGRVGKQKMLVPEMPALEVGKRYIVFVRGNGLAFCPLLAARFGNYPLTAEGTGGVERVQRADGAPLRNVGEIETPLHEASRSAGQKESRVDGMTRDEFETRIVSEVLHGREK